MINIITVEILTPIFLSRVSLRIMRSVCDSQIRSRGILLCLMERFKRWCENWGRTWTMSGLRRRWTKPFLWAPSFMLPVCSGCIPWERAHTSSFSQDPYEWWSVWPHHKCPKPALSRRGVAGPLPKASLQTKCTSLGRKLAYLTNTKQVWTKVSLWKDCWIKGGWNNS